MYKWVEANKGSVLIDTDKKKCLGYVYNYNGTIKARKLTMDYLYNSEDEVPKYDLGNKFTHRECAYDENGDEPKDFEKAKLVVEAACHAPVDPAKVIIGNDNILAFLAKLKDIEVHGRLEIIIKVENNIAEK